jgi:aromatic ring-opening dioxygenase catalytic subunit (LigB family)
MRQKLIKGCETMISSIFVCHGGPTLVIEKNEYTDFLKGLGKKLTPKAVVIFTAHWETEITTISSIDLGLAMEKQYEIGRAIKELGKEDILVIGSGSTVHNLATVDWNSEKAEEWAVEFDSWLIEKVENNDKEALFNY